MEIVESTLLKCNTFVQRAFRASRSNSTTSTDRYEVCKLLANKGVPNVIWLEDLLALHGSNTQVWDLNLLVEDTHSKFEDEPEFSERAIRMAHSQSSTGVVLLFTKDWYYDLGEDVQNSLPPIHSFLDSMIEFWLNISSLDYVDRLGFTLYIGCLIYYCYNLHTSDGEPVKNIAYAEKLKPEHQEVHYNITSAELKEQGFTATSRHTYHVRRSREIKEGSFIPKPYAKGAFRAPLTTLSE